MQELDNLTKRILQAESLLLLTHENPDGDAIGSMIALFLVLKNQLNKKVDIVCTSKIPKPFIFLPQINKIKSDFIVGDYDLIVVLDCGDLRRTGFSNRLKELTKIKKKIINIDHHPKNDIHKIAKINYVDYNASSTAELIYRLIVKIGARFDKDVATCLLCGLYTDTGAFKHSNTTVQVLQIASFLMNHGAKMKLITNNITNGKSTVALKLWGIVLSRIKVNKSLGLVSSIVTYEDIKKCQASHNDLAGAVNLINTIPDTNAAILICEVEPGKIKASIRTEKHNVDVSQLAALFGGGGLKKASGFALDGKIVSDGNGGWSVETVES
ncbi:MAG: hypothetical protein ACD_58C00149G0005 [uncultured bacterium]|nr:MAG: hypothetical protein ACD_58C00149G0005 [uncultured bacterium]